MHEKDVLISGASIAGPALAFWLGHHGFRPTIVERAPAPRPGGQTVDLRGAGRAVVERMGLLPAVREVAVPERGIAYVDGTGRRRAELPATAFGGQGVVAEIEVLRGDLTHLLVDATRDDTEYLFDNMITGLEQDENGVTARFEHGPQRRFGLVVGADGLHSGVRALAFGPESRFVRPLDLAMSFFTVPDRYDLDGWFHMHNAPGVTLALRPDRTPGQVKALVGVRAPGPVHHRDLAGQRALVTRALDGVGWVGPQVLADLPASPDFYLDTLGQVHLPTWSSGRVALVGDAGYCPSPLSGMGTSLALVGAYVLAGELAAGDPPAAAFARYEATMRPYVAQGQELPPGGVRGFAPGTRAEIALFRSSVRWMTRWPLRSLLARQFGKADAITLPDHGTSTLPARLR